MKKEELLQGKEEYLDLAWTPGEAQADFGELDVYWRGVLTRMFYLTLAFP